MHQIERNLAAYTNREDSDLLAHPRSQITVVPVCINDYKSLGISRANSKGWSILADVQPDLIPERSHIVYGPFLCDVTD